MSLIIVWAVLYFESHCKLCLCLLKVITLCPHVTIGINWKLSMNVTEDNLRLVRTLWLVLLLFRHESCCLYFLFGKYLIIAYHYCLYMLILAFLACYVVHCLHRRSLIYLHLLPLTSIGYSCVCTQLIPLASLSCSRKPVTQKLAAKLLCACPWLRSRHPNAPSGRFRDLRAQCADYLEIWKPQTLGTLWACPGL
jgi:hypothetical protein